MSYDLAVTEFKGKIVLHKADCPIVREQAAAGRPVMTMFDCKNEPPDEIERHDCLGETRP